MDAPEQGRIGGLELEQVTVRTGGTYEGLFYRPTVLGDVPVDIEPIYSVEPR